MNRRVLIAALALLAGATVSGHELTTMGPTMGAFHKEYHRVSAAYPLVDQMTLKKGHEPGSWSLLWFFDPEKSYLYRCSLIGEDILCSPEGSPLEIAWSAADVEYGRANGLTPVDRRSAPTVYMLEAQTPFAQSTDWAWYTGPGRVVRCRTTFTEYAFEAPTAQGSVFIESDQAPKVSRECVQLFPK